jgi:DNA-directed RNA polymerase specialized sigma24 family protein
LPLLKGRLADGQHCEFIGAGLVGQLNIRRKEDEVMTAETGQQRDDLSVTDQVTRARSGDQHAWDALVERYAPLVWSISDLPPGDRQLITLLIQEPPVPYAEISTRLGISVGSIGPKRRRCLERLRHHPALAALVGNEAGAARERRPSTTSGADA